MSRFIPPARGNSLGSVWVGTRLFSGGVIDPDAFGLVVEGNEFAPEIRHGQVAIVSPSLPLRLGMVALWAAGQSGGIAMRRLVKAPKGSWQDEPALFVEDGDGRWRVIPTPAIANVFPIVGVAAFEGRPAMRALA